MAKARENKNKGVERIAPVMPNLWLSRKITASDLWHLSGDFRRSYRSAAELWQAPRSPLAGIFLKSQNFQGIAQQIRHRCLPTATKRKVMLSTPQCQTAGALPTRCCHSQKCSPWKRIPPGMYIKGLEMLICWHNCSQEISCQWGRKSGDKKNYRNVCLTFYLNPKYTLGFVLVFYFVD